MSDGYNGWTNWATWNVALWFGNDEGLYGTLTDHYNRAVDKPDADEIGVLVREFFPNGTPDMESAERLAEVDFDQLADSWGEDFWNEDDEE